MLRGGDHGAKVAAERRFRLKDGPRVLVCTAAGREGINLQFARVLFNFDLPWNPMDMEQRIGRIHRFHKRIQQVRINVLIVLHSFMEEFNDFKGQIRIEMILEIFNIG